MGWFARRKKRMTAAGVPLRPTNSQATCAPPNNMSRMATHLAFDGEVEIAGYTYDIGHQQKRTLGAQITHDAIKH
jgi:hypothetical protein